MVGFGILQRGVTGQVVANSGKLSIHPPQRWGSLEWDEEQETGLYLFCCVMTAVCNHFNTAHVQAHCITFVVMFTG